MMNPHTAKRIASITASAALAITVIMVTGCASQNGEPTAFTRMKGELNTIVGYSLDPVFKATSKAIDQLQFTKVSEKKDALLAILISTTAADKKVEVRLTKITEGTTRIQIHVDSFGDETINQALLSRINEILK